MTLTYKELSIRGLILIEPKVYPDERGFFLERYKKSDFDKLNLPAFIQDNYSFSKHGVIRGLHFQREPAVQGKLVSVLSGKIWDVAVDLRKGSPTFGQHIGVDLSDENNLSFYIPPGFAHGFSVLSQEAKVLYKCTTEYSREHEGGIRFDDPELHIDWKVESPIVSAKDLEWPDLKSI